MSTLQLYIDGDKVEGTVIWERVDDYDTDSESQYQLIIDKALATSSLQPTSNNRRVLKIIGLTNPQYFSEQDYSVELQIQYSAIPVEDVDEDTEFYTTASVYFNAPIYQAATTIAITACKPEVDAENTIVIEYEVQNYVDLDFVVALKIPKRNLNY